MSDNSQGSGAAPAAIAGAGVGAGIGYASLVASKASRGVKGIIADNIHKTMDSMATPEKFKKVAERGFSTVQEMAGHAHTAISNIETKPEMLESLGINAEQAAELSSGPFEEIKEVLAKFKGMKFSEIPEEVWKEAHGHFKQVSEQLKPMLETAGLKKSFIASVPGGAKTLTSVAAVIGATLAYMTVSGIEKSHRSAVEQSQTASASASASQI